MNDFTVYIDRTDRIGIVPPFRINPDILIAGNTPEHWIGPPIWDPVPPQRQNINGRDILTMTTTTNLPVHIYQNDAVRYTFPAGSPVQLYRLVVPNADGSFDGRAILEVPAGAVPLVPAATAAVPADNRAMNAFNLAGAPRMARAPLMFEPRPVMLRRLAAARNATRNAIRFGGMPFRGMTDNNYSHLMDEEDVRDNNNADNGNMRGGRNRKRQSRRARTSRKSRKAHKSRKSRQTRANRR